MYLVLYLYIPGIITYYLFNMRKLVLLYSSMSDITYTSYTPYIVIVENLHSRKEILEVTFVKRSNCLKEREILEILKEK